VGWKTEFHASDYDGYKKCVCSYLPDSDPNCQQNTADYNKDPEAQDCGAPDPTPPPTPPSPEKTPLEELMEMLIEIKEKPHFNDENMSLTTW
jgi:hypothetical protein